MNLRHLLGLRITAEPVMSRRGFLGLTAATLAGLLVAPEVLAKPHKPKPIPQRRTKTLLSRKNGAKRLADGPRLARKKAPVNVTFYPPTASNPGPFSIRRGLFARPTASSPSPSAFFIRSGLGERRLSLYNIHTGESLNTLYWANNRYVYDSLREINYLLRDHHSGEVTNIDRQLLDLLYQINGRVDNRFPFEVLSGYRSAATNAMKAERSSAVARHSLHIQGRAVDIRLPRTSLSSLRLAAASLQQGGVGYYPRSGFIHVDTGDVRYW